MASYKEYFDAIAYKPKYFLGDRVSGTWNKIPFMGTVGNDRCINGIDKEITIHLDLPIRLNKQNHNVIIVKHKDIKKLPVWD